MIIIADAGASETQWRVIGPDVVQIASQGLSLSIHTPSEIIYSLGEVIKTNHLPNDGQFQFYIAGLITGKDKLLLERLFKEVFPESFVVFEDDLLAAARASCGTNPGIACILGTGSNACLYDGVKIVKKVNPLGYILGDEGSGSDLGKHLLINYLRGNLPEEINSSLEPFKLSYEFVVQKVYHDPEPRKFLNSFSRFLIRKINHPYIYQLVYERFSTYFEVFIKPLTRDENFPVHFIGSIAFYFGNILRQVANDKGVILKNIAENPIAGLSLYHRSK